MPRKKPMLSTTVVNDVVEVHSTAYGKHYRKPRGSMTPISINDSFKKSIGLNNIANPAAKAIKDATDPFRKDMKDGTMWPRLVGLFKKHLAKNPTIDFHILERFLLVDKVRKHLAISYRVQPTVSIAREENQSFIHIEISSTHPSEIERHVSNYLQKTIMIFLDANFKSIVYSDEIIFPIAKTSTGSKEQTKTYHQQIVRLPVPAGATWAIIVVRSEPAKDGKEFGPAKFKKIRIVKVHKFEDDIKPER